MKTKVLMPLVLLSAINLYAEIDSKQETKQENKQYLFTEVAAITAQGVVKRLPKDALLAVIGIDHLYSHLESYIVSLLETNIISTDRLKLISRNKIDTVLKEQKLGSTGIISDKTAQKIGKILGTKYILTGELLNPNKKYTLSIQVLEVETALVLYSNVFEISKAELKGYSKRMKTEN